MALLTAAYPNFEPKPQTVAVYVQMLKDIPGEDLFRAARQCIATLKFFPTVAEIREKAQQSHLPSAAEAWQEVTRQIWQSGYYGKPQFQNPLVAQIVTAMGWRELCTSENQIADRAHFMRMYDELAQRAQAQFLALNSGPSRPQLTGRIASDNQ